MPPGCGWSAATRSPPTSARSSLAARAAGGPPRRPAGCPHQAPSRVGGRAAATDGLRDQALFKVWGASAGDAWAVGTGGLILHFDGAAWALAASPTSERLIAVGGASAAE